MATTKARSLPIPPEELELLEDELELELEDDELLELLEDELDDEELLDDEEELLEELGEVELPPQPTSAIDAKAGMSQRAGTSQRENWLRFIFLISTFFIFLISAFPNCLPRVIVDKTFLTHNLNPFPAKKLRHGSYYNVVQSPAPFSAYCFDW